MTRRKLRASGLILAGAAVMFTAGCVVDIEPIPGDGNGDGNGDGGATTLTVRIVNSTNTDLDPEIFVSAEPVTRDELFAAGNKFTQFGVFDAGVLGPGGVETFALDCAAARVIGTTGGRFESETDPSMSDREIVLTQDLVYRCGDRITFTYSRSASGFRTRFDLD